MKKYIISTCLFLSFSLLHTAFYANPAENKNASQSHGGGEYIFEKRECINDAQREEIMAKLEINIRMLRNQGKLRDNPEAIVLFSWPLRKIPSLDDYYYWGISNYVDHNTASGLLDYNCGARTYNGHKGTDIFTWPFGWYKMDYSQIEVIAAAPGIIVYKHDGEFDRSCTSNSNLWNAVYVRHSDNSIAWYGHLKKNSVTTKNVGDSVILGEYLGVLGSSGNSTGPHLHFEIYNGSNTLVDPWQGNCNQLNTQTWWQNQKPYFDPKVNALMTHSRPPVFPACPQQEVINEKRNFNPGDSAYFITYYSDQQANLPTLYTILMPDNTIFNTWSHFSNSYYSASYWYWRYILPQNIPSGVWTFRAVFNSVTYERTFTVSPVGIEPVEGEIPSAYSIKQNYPNPFNPVTSIEFTLPKSSFVELVIYDINGREITTLVNQNMNTGIYKVNWDATGYSSGVYLYRFITASHTATRKMLVIK